MSYDLYFCNEEWLSECELFEAEVADPFFIDVGSVNSGRFFVRGEDSCMAILDLLSLHDLMLTREVIDV